MVKTHLVLCLLNHQFLSQLDPFLEHQWILHAVEDFEEELLLLQKFSIGDLHLCRGGHAESGHTAHEGQKNQCQFHSRCVHSYCTGFGMLQLQTPKDCCSNRAAAGPFIPDRVWHCTISASDNGYGTAKNSKHHNLITNYVQSDSHLSSTLPGSTSSALNCKLDQGR